jgi:hypothetical protein
MIRPSSWKQLRPVNDVTKLFFPSMKGLDSIKPFAPGIALIKPAIVIGLGELASARETRRTEIDRQDTPKYHSRRYDEELLARKSRTSASNDVINQQGRKSAHQSGLRVRVYHQSCRRY